MAEPSRSAPSEVLTKPTSPLSPLPQSPPAVYSQRSQRLSNKAPRELPSDAYRTNERAFMDNAARFSSTQERKRVVPIPDAGVFDGAYVHQTPSALIVHAPATPNLAQPSSVTIEDHASQLSSLRSRPQSRLQTPPQSHDSRQTKAWKSSLSPYQNPGQEDHRLRGESETGSAQDSEDMSPSHNRARSLGPDTQFHGGAYRHVSSPIIQTDNHEPLQYHHQAFSDRLTPVDKRASKLTVSSRSDGSEPNDTQRGHEHMTTSEMRNSVHGRSLQRPDSGFSSISDFRGRARSPHYSPNNYARATSAHSSGHSPDTRPLSYVDLLNVPYPQPPPIAAEALDNTKLRNAVGQNASLLSNRQTLEMYRANVKKTHDPAVQYEFAIFMINAAQEMNLNMENLSLSDGPDKSSATTKNELLKEARTILQRLSDRSYPFAQYYLADGYFSGLLSNGKEDYEKAFPLFVAAAKHGHAEAGYRTALCYEFGWGCHKNGAKASLFYRQAASKNHPGAMLRLAKACLNGDLGLGHRYREGVTWLKRAAEAADFQYNSGPYELGLLHETGYGDDVFRDESYAAQLFTKSADLGHAEANYRLGDAYEHGKLTCPRDPALAVHFYTGAAERDYPLAQMALCAWYMVGAEPVLEKDEDEAYQWALKAAEAGLPKAEYAVGYFSEMGIGCRRDNLAANHWYSKAAIHGDTRAIHRMAAINAASTGADPETAAASPIEKRHVLKPSTGSSANIGHDGEKVKHKKFGVF